MINLKKESLEEKISFDDKPKENCALAAAIGIPNAAKYVFDCLVLQEHRGEKGTGIASSDKELYVHKDLGLAKNVFSNFNFSQYLPGDIAIGHNRYATAGEPNARQNLQPFYFKESKFGSFLIAHNGNLVNINPIKEKLIREGAVFQSTVDTELFGHLLAHSSEKRIEDAIISAADEIQTAYSFLIMTPDKVIAMKDRFGVRPLGMTKLDDGFLVCSESYASEQYENSKFIRDINPGEIIIFEKGKKEFESIQYAEPNPHFCIFEGIYFSNPRSMHNLYIHEDFR